LSPSPRRAARRPAEENPAAEKPAAAAPSNEELSRRIDALTQELESLKLGEVAAPPEQPGRGRQAKESSARRGRRTSASAGASKVYRVKSGLSIGGYGESVYQNFDGKTDSGADSGKTNQWIPPRVLYVG